MTLNNEAFLTQIGIQTNQANLNQLKTIEVNTKNFELLKKHIVQLEDKIKIYEGFVVLSNNKDNFKIKTHAWRDETIGAYETTVRNWAAKHRIKLETTTGLKKIFYIVNNSNGVTS